MSTTTVNTANTAYYAVYRTNNVRINYYSGSAYTTRTDIYRNGVYGTNTNYTMYLATSNTGLSNYGTAAGPGSSAWAGLSTASDTTPEYTNVGTYNSGAAYSSSATFYTVYQFNVTYSKGSNMSSIGATSGSCRVNATSTSAGGTSCSVTLPSITPNTGYVSVGWGTSSGATSGTSAGSSYTLNSNPRTLYANANCQGVSSGTYTVGSTISYAGSSWTVVRDNGSSVDLAYNGKIDGNGSTTGTSGGSYTNASSAVATWLNSNNVTKAALQSSCLTNKGSSSNTKTNGPSVTYWIDSGKVNEPEEITTYSTYTTAYASGRSGAKTSLADVITSVLTESVASSYGTSQQYAANSTVSLDNSNTTITYSNAKLNQSSRSNLSQHILWNNPTTVCGTPSTNYMPRYIGLVDNGWGTVWAATCYNDNGADYVKECDGSWSQVNEESNGYAYKSSYWDDYYRYWNENINLYFGWAGSPSVSIASGSSTWFYRVYDMSCPSVPVYSITNYSKTVYYRPFIQVVEQ